MWNMVLKAAKNGENLEEFEHERAGKINPTYMQLNSTNPHRNATKAQENSTMAQQDSTKSQLGGRGRGAINGSGHRRANHL
jgi:hypothetical protein